MITENKYRTLIWIAVILFVMNLATIGSLIYHTLKKGTPPASSVQTEAEQGARFFFDRLDLTTDQTGPVREAYREYNRSTNHLVSELRFLRVDMVEQMTKADPDTVRLNEIYREIGSLHEALKKKTAEYYLQLRSVCTTEQRLKLDAIFRDMVSDDEDEPVQRGRRRGWGWNR